MKFEFDYQCDKEWDEMEGGDKRRFCDSCDKHVHHISSMTKAQALKFLAARNWDVCVDFFTDAEGETEFRDAGHRLSMQTDGLKQLVASTLAVLPLALAAMFIDFDAEPEIETVAAQPNPIDLSGPTPLFVPTVVSDIPIETPAFVLPEPAFEPNIEPVVVEEPEPEVVVEPVIEEIPKPEIQPTITPERPHLRGRIRRPDF